MWQGINNITGFKGNKPATVNIVASLPDEPNTFYARFEADNTAHTERAPAAAAEVSPLSLSVADVTRSFKWVNIRKAVGPDGIPGRAQSMRFPMALFHCMVRYGSARLGTVRYGSVRVGLHFHRSLVPLEWAGLFTRRYNCAASTAVTSS